MSTSNSVVCEEIFDEVSHPSIDEIRDYATKIGIDPEVEPQLLPLAAEGLMKALPSGWQPVFDEKSKSYYYYDNNTGRTQWEHPLDEVYRNKVRQKRTESQSMSIGEHTEDSTYARDELPSFEEQSLIMKPFEISQNQRKIEVKLFPLNYRPNDPPKLLRQKSEEKPISAYVNKKIGLSLSSSFDGKPDQIGESPKKDFRLSGSGFMFLKSKAKKAEELFEKKVEQIITIDSNDEEIASIVEEIEVIEKGDSDNDAKTRESTAPRSILRERSFIEAPKLVEDDDKKNVRFNLEESTNTDTQSQSVEKDIQINVTVTKIKQKPRFVLSPMRVDRMNFESNKNLKLIRPNPTDFVKPMINTDCETSTAVSDSEDDSIMKSIEKCDRKLAYSEETQRDDLHLCDEHKSNITEKYHEDNIAIIKQLKQNADRELEEMKKSVWEEKNEEIAKYKQELQESQSEELQRILSSEKGKYEENIKSELENLRSEMQCRNLGALEQEKVKLDESLEKLKTELSIKHREKQVKLEEEFEEKVVQLNKRFEEKFRDLEKELTRDLDKHKDELIVSHNAILDQIRQNHQAILDEVKRDFKSAEKIIRKEHDNQLTELKKKVSANLDTEVHNSSNTTTKDVNEERLYEKVRCEKRLLEDKYRCLKDKYLRLKTDVKLSIEKKNRKREQSATTTTGSETERSNSINKERSPHRSPMHVKTIDKPPLQRAEFNINRRKEHRTTTTVIIQDLDTSISDDHSKNDKIEPKNEYDSSEENANACRSRKKLFSRLKSNSASRVNNNKSKKTARSCSPVENLRRQLQKLEDLEDQFPQNPQADTYHLRYPFSDGQKFEGSSELEFFRHRIHLERDSIKRAKEGLRTQKCLFQQRQNDLKLKHGSMARHTLQQLCQEEKDLTDMEVSLHRTRALLGEKVIRLRHLEQSLQRATAVSNEQNKLEEATLSDLSSHSASSGISSTEFATAGDGNNKTILRGEHLQESSEIIQSLENLNLEIREIWEVLSQQQQAGSIASVMPLPLVYPELGWPVLAGTATVPAPPSIPTLADRLHNYRQHVALTNAQSTVVTHANQGATTTLVDRTRNLRHWLRQAGIDPGVDVTPQATL